MKYQRLLALVIVLCALVGPSGVARADAPKPPVWTFLAGSADTAVIDAEWQAAVHAGNDPSAVTAAIRSQLVTTAAVRTTDTSGVIPQQVCGKVRCNFGPEIVTETISYYNIFGIRMASFNLRKTWWGDKIVTVTIAPPPDIWGDTSATAISWTYLGVVVSGTFFYPYTGHPDPHAGSRSFARGSFQLCVLKVGCIEQLVPYAWVDGHFDLSWVKGGSR